mgnify:CR=1 FL=1
MIVHDAQRRAMFARLRFLPNAFSYTPSDLQESLKRDFEWLSYYSPRRSDPLVQNQFAMVSDRVQENVKQLTDAEMRQLMSEVPTVVGLNNEIH